MYKHANLSPYLNIIVSFNEEWMFFISTGSLQQTDLNCLNFRRTVVTIALVLKSINFLLKKRNHFIGLFLRDE